MVKKYEKDSENVKNNREFEAINKEIEMQQLEVKLCEKHIKDANEEVAEKAVALEKANKAIATKEGVLNGKKGELEKLLLQLKKKRNYLINRRKKHAVMLMTACLPAIQRFVKITAMD